MTSDVFFTMCVGAFDVRICVCISRHTHRYDYSIERAGKSLITPLRSVLTSPSPWLVSFPPSVALSVTNSQHGSGTWKPGGFEERWTHAGPGRLAACTDFSARKPGLRGARLKSKPPSSFKRSNIFSIFVDIMNPKPSAGFLFCCGQEHQTRMGVEAGGEDR